MEKPENYTRIYQQVEVNFLGKEDETDGLVKCPWQTHFDVYMIKIFHGYLLKIF